MFRPERLNSTEKFSNKEAIQNPYIFQVEYNLTFSDLPNLIDKCNDSIILSDIEFDLFGPKSFESVGIIKKQNDFVRLFFGFNRSFSTRQNCEVLIKDNKMSLLNISSGLLTSYAMYIDSRFPQNKYLCRKKSIHGDFLGELKHVIFEDKKISGDNENDLITSGYAIHDIHKSLCRFLESNTSIDRNEFKAKLTKYRNPELSKLTPTKEEKSLQNCEEENLYSRKYLRTLLELGLVILDKGEYKLTKKTVNFFTKTNIHSHSWVSDGEILTYTDDETKLYQMFENTFIRNAFFQAKYKILPDGGINLYKENIKGRARESLGRLVVDIERNDSRSLLNEGETVYSQLSDEERVNYDRYKKKLTQLRKSQSGK